MEMTDLSFMFLILPVLTAAGIFLKGRGRDILLSVFSLVFIYNADFEAFKLLIIPIIDLAAIFFLRRSDWTEEKVKLTLNVLISKSAVVLVIWVIISSNLTPLGVSLIFFDIMALNYFRMSGRSLNESDFIMYVLFFPKLFAGPYPSPKSFLRNRNNDFSIDLCAEGISLFIWGCGKEIILVKQLEGIISNIFYHYESRPSVFFAWALAFLSALKVYLYLSSFGDMGRGIGKIFMFDMPKGAFYPFFSPSVREFVKRMGLSLYDTLGGAVSFWGTSLKKKTRNYLNTFLCIAFINMLLISQGASWGFSLYFLLCLAADYLFISKIGGNGRVFSAFFVLAVTLPAFIFTLPVNLEGGLGIILNMFYLGGAPLFARTTLYFSAANVVLVSASFVFSTGLIYAGGSFLKKVAPNIFKAAAIVVVVSVMVVSASFALLEGGF